MQSGIILPLREEGFLCHCFAGDTSAAQLCPHLASVRSHLTSCPASRSCASLLHNRGNLLQLVEFASTGGICSNVSLECPCPKWFFSSSTLSESAPCRLEMGEDAQARRRSRGPEVAAGQALTSLDSWYQGSIPSYASPSASKISDNFEWENTFQIPFPFVEPHSLEWQRNLNSLT
jgi:hypothetical protein